MAFYRRLVLSMSLKSKSFRVFEVVLCLFAFKKKDKVYRFLNVARFLEEPDRTFLGHNQWPARVSQ